VPFGCAMCAAKLRTPNIWPDEPALVTGGRRGGQHWVGCEGQMALVTAGASVIGLGRATHFVADGARVLIPDLDASLDRVHRLGESPHCSQLVRIA